MAKLPTSQGSILGGLFIQSYVIRLYRSQHPDSMCVCVNAVEAINMMVMSINVLVVVPLTIHCADRLLAIEIVQTDSSTGKLVSGQARQLSSSSASALAKLPQSNGWWLAD